MFIIYSKQESVLQSCASGHALTLIIGKNNQLKELINQFKIIIGL